MAKFTETRKLLPQDTLDQFKQEVAEQTGLADDIEKRGFPQMKSKECGKIGGKIGGKMVRVLIRHAEEALASNSDVKI